MVIFSSSLHSTHKHTHVPPTLSTVTGAGKCGNNVIKRVLEKLLYRGYNELQLASVLFIYLHATGCQYQWFVFTTIQINIMCWGREDVANISVAVV